MEAVVDVSESKNAAAGEQLENNVVVHEKHDAVHGGCDTETAVLTAESEPQSNHRKHNRIHVSCNKKPFLFYVNLAKKFLNQYEAVELSALGTAITTLIIISENLKRNGWAIEKSVTVSTIVSKGDQTGRLFHKAKIEILLVKPGQMDQTTGDSSNEDADNSAITE
ncbi:hypothetical protein QN277_027066 [Acacia crassicarpa]|uniref:DNA/RNA-binding protein Alba-like domain-containing protein n=1 Tax=Acacia crassicarpa TaxID=499986 RepID=A0AAE1MMK1_9FABA|nr:hypothetical protein QN277_027066 [Acacia crassicarpa]